MQNTPVDPQTVVNHLLQKLSNANLENAMLVAQLEQKEQILRQMEDEKNVAKKSKETS